MSPNSSVGVTRENGQPARGSELLLHVNGFGGTPLMELYLLFHCAAERLDDELKSLWDAPAHTAALHW